MNRIKYGLILILSSFLAMSCSKQLRYFTSQMQEEFNWSENELRQIQFYLSEDIVLRRSLGAEDSRITEGKIRVIDGREVEEIVFKRGTPGLLIFSPRDDRFAISFENEDDRYLMFGPNQKAEGKYVLLAKEWEQRRGKVTYNDRVYETTSESAYAALMVDIKKARNVAYKSRTVKGRTIE